MVRHIVAVYVDEIDLEEQIMGFGHWLNARRQILKFYKDIYQHYCKKCGKFFIPIHKCQVYCSKICSSISQQKVKRPSKEELLELIKSTSFLQIGKIYGVSDNAVRKWCKSYGLPYKQKDIRSL